MFENGLVAEVRAILASGVASSAKPFEALGYSQALAHLEGRLSYEEAISLTQQATRQYAKRQMTWFRREQDVTWFKNFGTVPDVQCEALSHVRARIK
jgi:tRNA dimethylallyltransferase